MSTLVVFVAIVWILSKLLGVRLRRIVRGITTISAICLYMTVRFLLHAVAFSLITLVILALILGFLIIRHFLRNMR